MLILDEVISGFRVGQGGAWELYGIEPDLVTYGKIVGGGLPVGAFGGKREYMEKLAPLGPVYQAGTLSGNPLAMAAGLATLKTLQAENGWEKLEQLGQYLEERLGPILAKNEATLVRQGSLFWMSLQPGEAPRSAEAIDAGAADRYRPIFHKLLDEGIALAPSAYEVGFLSIAHAKADVDRLADALERAFSEVSAR
jgi:glutamate-1-semialdehyde 2,1-aminomutase